MSCSPTGKFPKILILQVGVGTETTFFFFFFKFSPEDVIFIDFRGKRDRERGISFDCTLLRMEPKTWACA